jgi:hypothetical protein
MHVYINVPPFFTTRGAMSHNCKSNILQLLFVTFYVNTCSHTGTNPRTVVCLFLFVVLTTTFCDNAVILCACHTAVLPFARFFCVAISHLVAALGAAT